MAVVTTAGYTFAYSQSILDAASEKQERNWQQTMKVPFMGNRNIYKVQIALAFILGDFYDLSDVIPADFLSSLSGS